MKVCPTSDQLSQLLAEELSHADLESVSEHVQQCGMCQQALETLVGYGRPEGVADPSRRTDAEFKFLDELKKLGPGFSQGDSKSASNREGGGERRLPGTIGEYTILTRLGVGSTAVVYKARDPRLGRFVAVKLIQPRANEQTEVRARFQREATAVARLQHPDLVQIFEVGEHEGRPFLVMEFVDSGSLADYLRGNPQPPALAAAFVEQIVRGVACAHAAGVVHRDLKPGNILLAARQPRALDNVHRPPLDAFAPKVADFGLAKCFGEDVDLTTTDTLIGTPTYLAPEQIKHSGISSPSCDIYALGVLLYEMLCGRPPLVGPTILATLRLVAAAEPLAPRRLQPQIPRPLETICLKCLAKDPARRYASALDLADDLRGFCEGRPIRARPVGVCERIWLWCKRNPVVAALAASLVATIVTAGCALVLLLIRVHRHAEEAEAHARRADDRAYVADMRMVQHVWDAHHIGRLRELLDAHQPDGGGGIDRRGFEWFLWNQLGHLDERTIGGHTSWVNCVCYRPDGRFLASASDDGTLWIWAAHTGKLVRKIDAGARLFDICYSPDGRFLAGAAASKKVQVWDAETGRPTASLGGHTHWITTVSFSPDGQRLASGARDGTIRIWNPAGGKALLELRGHDAEINTVRYSPDGRWLASAARDGTVKIWDASSGKLDQTLAPSDEPKCLAFAADGTRLAVGLEDGTLTIWELPAGKLRSSIPAHVSWITSVEYRPDGRELLTASSDRTIRIWDVATDREVDMLQGHAEWIANACFSPDGRLLASASHDGTIKIWDPNHTRGIFKLPQFPGIIAGTCFSPDSKTLALAIGGSVQLSSEPPEKPRVFPVADAPIGCMSFSADGRLLAVGSDDGRIHIWSPQSEHQKQVISERGPPIIDLCFASQARSLVSISRTGRVVDWNLKHDPPAKERTLEIGPIAAASLAPQGRRVAAVFDDGMLRVWDVAAGKLLWQCQAHKFAATAVAYSLDGRLIASGSTDKMVRIWDAQSGQPQVTLNGHTHTIRAIAFSADGERVATAGNDKLFKLWTVDAGQELFSVKVAAARPMRIAFSPDDAYLVTSAGSSAVLWHAPRP